MINQLIKSLTLILFLSLSIITNTISCEDFLDISVQRPDGPFSHGEIVTIEVYGIWLGGGINSDVNEHLSYSGDIDIISKTSNNQWEVLEIRIDSNRHNELIVMYDFEIEENQFEDYQSCSITETYTFEIKQETISCEHLLEIFVDRPDGPFCDGDIVTIEVLGAWLGGGISSDVNEYLSYSGDIDIISESNNYPYEVLKIRIDSKRENKLKVRYNFEIEENQFEDYQSCSISRIYTFEVIPKVIPCEENLTIDATNLDGPFCDGDIVTMEVCGYWLGGGINSNVNEDLSFSGDIDIISESSNYPCVELEMLMDSKRENKLNIRYDFEIEGNQFEEHQTCSISETFKFDVMQSEITGEFLIKWRQGDILEIQNNDENICYQWGEVIDNVETDIIGETTNEFSPNSSAESIFISSINNKKPIPKDDFDRDYYVRLYECDVTNAQCDRTLYFTSDNFDFVPFYDDHNLTELEYNIYPNPGNGVINISTSGILQNSTPFPTIVTDVNGNRLVMSDLIHEWNGTYIDISTAPSGFYFIYFETGDETFEKFKYCKF